MVVRKKKINVIRPTLRHKKRYISFNYLKPLPVTTKIKVYLSLFRSLVQDKGLVIANDANITVLSVDESRKEVLVRINMLYLDDFLSSLFLNKDFALITNISIKSTIKQFKE